MRILMVGDLVGGSGRRLFAWVVSRMRQQEQVDFIVVNAENAAGGRGITPALAQELFSAGADVITLGDHVWDQKELIPHIAKEPRILRAANMAPNCPGKGWITVPTPAGNVTVVSLIGRVFMPPADCPFRAMDELLKRGTEFLGKIILVDLHAEATSEKIAMGWHLDGRVSAVVGTHTHVQTADETILPQGTAYITDLGMTGPKKSVIGRDIKSVLGKFVTGMPHSFEIATGDVRCEGLLVTVDEKTGLATKVKRIQEKLDPPK